MKNLMKVMLSDLDSKVEASLLFTERPELYEPFGFKGITEYYFTTMYEHDGRTSVHTVTDPIDPFDITWTNYTRKLLKARLPLSQEFSPLHYAPSFFLNMYNDYFRKRLYWIQDLQTIIVYSIKDSTLELYDVIGRENLTLQDICQRLSMPFSKIQIFFNPDQFPEFNWTPIPL